jgi:Ca-activated chloride channel family protein
MNAATSTRTYERVSRFRGVLRGWLILPLALTSTVEGGHQQAAFSAKVEAVRVDVLVTDKGQPMRGLGPADFEIFDNGVPQNVELVSFEQIPLNVILALDMSDSVAGERLGHLRTAGHALLNGLKHEDQAALVTFRRGVTLDADLTSDARTVRAALDEAEPAGETALVDGAYSAMVVGESDAGRALLIVFSDGLDTSSWLLPDSVLETAKRSDVVAYAVSIGRVKAEFLRDLTSFTGGRLFEIEKTGNLSAIFLSVLEEFRQRYLVSYTPRGVAKEGWHRLTVKVKRGGATVKARPGYLAAF